MESAYDNSTIPELMDLRFEEIEEYLDFGYILEGSEKQYNGEQSSKTNMDIEDGGVLLAQQGTHKAAVLHPDDKGRASVGMQGDKNQVMEKGTVLRPPPPSPQRRSLPQRPRTFLREKSRLQWTEDLNRRFNEAINALGGIHYAKPKDILKLMNVNTLDVTQVKNHLQLCRSRKGSTKNSAEAHNTSPYAAQMPRSQNDWESTRDSGGNEASVEELGMELSQMLKVEKQLQRRLDAQNKYLSSLEELAHRCLFDAVDAGRQSGSRSGTEVEQHPVRQNDSVQVHPQSRPGRFHYFH